MSSTLTGKLERDVEIKASAQKFHDMLCHRPHHLPHACAEKVQRCELLEGDWGTVGSIIQWSYVHDGEAKKGKQVIDEIDSEKNSITFRTIEGDILKEYKSFVQKFQATPKSEGEGCIVHFTFTYEKLHDGIVHPETFMEYAISIIADMSSHLIKGN